MSARDKEFWKRNFYNESAYTHARMSNRRPIIGSPKTLVNVGSNNGAEIRPYIDDGWRVFAFEPNPSLAPLLSKLEKEHKNFTYIPKAVSDEPSTGMEFFVSEAAPGISSFYQRDPDAVSTLVEVTTLADFCREYEIYAIDYLLIDAELYDLQVFNSLERGFPIGAVTLEFGGTQLPSIHQSVMQRYPHFEDIVFEYRKPLEENGSEKMGVAAKCVARSTYESYQSKVAKGTPDGKWGNIYYFDPRLEP